MKNSNSQNQGGLKADVITYIYHWQEQEQEQDILWNFKNSKINWYLDSDVEVECRRLILTFSNPN